VIAVAAISARMLAEACARDGIEVIALDLFGDADTRRVATDFFAVGEPQGMRMAPARVLAALAEIARRKAVIGWVAGSGFEGLPDLLAAGAALLPLIGTPADAVRRVRDPETFFGFLGSRGIGHPPTSFQPPPEPTGWLVKDADGCGGWHIRRATAAHLAAPPPGHYFQRERPGAAMSATFIGNGRDAVVLGFNRLQVRPVAGHAFVFCGAVGPVALPAEVGARVVSAVRAITGEFALRGLCSLDFLLDGAQVELLEVNPRPPASMALYPHLPLVTWHLRACRAGELPAPASHRSVAGHRTVFARRSIALDAAGARRLAEASDVHDLPAAGTRFEPGDPVCSVSTEITRRGAEDPADEAAVDAMLDARADHLLDLLEKAS
jgi:uncharacterized protein